MTIEEQGCSSFLFYRLFRILPREHPVENIPVPGMKGGDTRPGVAGSDGIRSLGGKGNVPVHIRDVCPRSPQNIVSLTQEKRCANYCSWPQCSPVASPWQSSPNPIRPTHVLASHREAPIISQDPTATDRFLHVCQPGQTRHRNFHRQLLSFRRSRWVGPNFYRLGDDVMYSINIDNVGDAQPHIQYQFQFSTSIQNPNTFLYNSGRLRL